MGISRISPQFLRQITPPPATNHITKPVFFKLDIHCVFHHQLQFPSHD